MKSVLAAVAAVCLAGVVGCSSGTRNVESPGGGDGVPCAQEVALQCEDGMIDACLADPAAATHVCVPAPAEGEGEGEGEGDVDGDAEVEGEGDDAGTIEDAPEGGE